MKKILNVVSAAATLILLGLFGSWYYTTGGKEIFLSDYTGGHISSVYDFCIQNNLKFTFEFAESVLDRNLILSQNITNIPVKEGRRINFTVSKGRPYYLVPDFKGMNFKEIFFKTPPSQRRFKLGVIYRMRTSENLEENTVVFQSPQPGTVISMDRPVSFVLAYREPEKLPAPDFTKLDFMEIFEAVAALGFKKGDIKYALSKEEYLIQYPPPGALILRNEPLNFMVFLKEENYRKYFRKYFNISYVLALAMDDLEVEAVKTDETGSSVLIKEYLAAGSKLELNGYVTGNGFVDIFIGGVLKKRYNF